MSADPRPSVYLESGRPVYRASASGGCLRALAAHRLGFEPVEAPEFLERAAREGERHEPWVVRELEEQGWTVSHRQEEVELEYPAFVIRGHIDGLAERDGAEHLLEIKTMSSRRFQEYRLHGLRRFPQYAAQISIYHQAFPGPILYAVKNRDSGFLDVRVLPEPPVPFDEVRDRLLTAELAARKGQLPACDYAPGSFERRICPFRYLCAGADSSDLLRDGASEARVIPIQALRLREWARRYLAASEAERAAKTLKEEARSELFLSLDALGSDRAEADGYRVSRVRGVRRGLDARRLEEDLGPALDPYRTETPYESVRVTAPKEVV